MTLRRARIFSMVPSLTGVVLNTAPPTPRSVGMTHMRAFQRSAARMCWR